MQSIGLWVRSILLGFLGLIVTIGLVTNYSFFGLIVAVIIDIFAIKNIFMLIEKYNREMYESDRRG